MNLACLGRGALCAARTASYVSLMSALVLLGGCGESAASDGPVPIEQPRQDAGEGDDVDGSNGSDSADSSDSYDSADGYDSADSGDSGSDSSDWSSTDGQTSDGDTDDGQSDGSDDDVHQGTGDLCHLKGSQVVVLGDSYIALDPSYVLLDSHPFTRNLQDLARAAGALGADEKYRDHALSGASMAAFPSIPGQFDDALAEDHDIRLVIMTGGGNDVLVFNRLCLEYGTEADLLKDAGCVKAVDDALAAGQKMFDKAVSEGLDAEVVYFFYPHLPGLLAGGIGAGTTPNVILDYAYPKVRALCEGQSEIPCHFVDLRPVFDKDGDGMPDPGMINIDGIHPTGDSSKLMAETVWAVMQEHCLASE